VSQELLEDHKDSRGLREPKVFKVPKDSKVFRVLVYKAHRESAYKAHKDSKAFLVSQAVHKVPQVLLALRVPQEPKVPQVLLALQDLHLFH
jgi:hypothetical protein